ncbi:MAG TPA: 50S ribosomal protein L18e [Methanobacteriaceae archaeon]|jgi:large subunit ribosomal protein L18e|nr:50S ribosomal protein L18e [Euryarchaeota archaeon]HNR25390.1 50S ribosomal protein L18e [Methanobacteriaceae archaeon]HNS24711.1 50S ribosomal protein L18e [Methanobacteriaceae archaeon]
MTKTNPQIMRIIEILKERSYQEGAALWKEVARRLEKPTRQGAEVNLSRINRHSSPDETVLVPGKVLGSGSLDHKVRVVALDFSQSAAEKIIGAGGECLDIYQLLEENPQGSGVRMIE